MQTEAAFEERYRMIEKLGEGSEGSVFLALYLPTEEFRAVKRIRAGSMAASCREPEMMKHLRNEHLPRIIDVLYQEPYIYLVMEHVRGMSLDRMLRSGGCVSEAQALEAGLQIADALCYLETRDPPVCHLDIKPSNLIRRGDGCIKLVDFGAAWKEQMELSGMGTDGYAAPEQYEAGTVADSRSDIYGLGAVLYRMVTGKRYSQPLHAAKTPNCSEGFAAVIGKCLEKDPAERFQSARELKGALLRLRRKQHRSVLRVRILGALALALPAAAFVTSVLPASVDLSGEREWNYAALLREAETCRPSEQMSLYRRAVFLEPGEAGAYLQYLEAAGADGVLEESEDEFLRDLLHTVALGESETNEEKLRRDPDAYGPVALQAGLLYWYCDEQEGADRVAAGWFRNAVRCAEETDDIERSWSRTASLYEGMVSVLELAGSREKGDADPESAARYWEILTELLEQGLLPDSALMKAEFYRDTLSDLSFLSRDLVLAGIGTGEITERIGRVLLAMRETAGPPESRKLLEMRKEQAEESGRLALAAVQNLEREEGGRKENG